MDKKIKKLLVCTFSGGRTSAFMAQFLNTYEKYKDYDKLFLFANTGKEKEETLKFIDKCDKEWNLGVVWIETKINLKKNNEFKIVNFKTASRNGEPFEDMLKKYPLPTMFGGCTRELKERPMKRYIKTLGYKQVITAIGIRFDERHRKSNIAKQENIVYPLCDDIKVDGKFIRNWWDEQSFDLQLKDYQGNCDLCFKKSIRKRLTLIKENPDVAKWWIKMENKYGTDRVPRFDLRSNKSVEQLTELAKKPFRTIEDKHEISKKQASLFDDLNMDIETDCFCKST